MARYFIYEGNLDRLEKKIKTISNKCAKYNVQFHYEKVGEEFRKVKTDEGTITAKFIEIDIEGVMKHQDWEFIAVVDHYEVGNIIRQYNTEIQIPERYYHTDAICEHCNTRRRRKFTYLVHNTSTDEWKQVGHSCLNEFTNGLDAEYVAKYLSLFNYAVQGEAPYTGVKFERYHNLETYLCYVKETMDLLGYVSKANAEDRYVPSTREDAFSFYLVHECGSILIKQSTLEREAKIGFNVIHAFSEENRQYVKDAINWIRSVSVEDAQDFLFTLKLACWDDYFVFRNIGIVTSLLSVYYRHLKQLEYQEKKNREANNSKSEYQGAVKERITFKAVSIECVYSSDSFYGVNYLYKFMDSSENVYMWSTSKSLSDKLDATELTITGTVKNHSEYKGVKQTHLTRCKIA